MKNGFPYFQFCPDKWLTGKVSSFDLDGQGLFLHFCMTAWAGHGLFNICRTSVQLRFRKTAQWVDDTVNAMLAVGILAQDGQQYRIKFIDEQIAGLQEIREKRSKAGKASAEVRTSSGKGKKRKVKNRREEKSSVLKSVQHVLNTCSTDGLCFEGRPAFQKVWAEWVSYRINFGKKPKSWVDMFQKQLAFMSRFGTPAAIEIMETSMRNAWQGLFPPPTPTKPGANAPREVPQLPKKS